MVMYIYIYIYDQQKVSVRTIRMLGTLVSYYHGGWFLYHVWHKYKDFIV